MVTTWPSASVTACVSTAIAPSTSETGVHPGCSVVDVVVGGMVVGGIVVVGGAFATVFRPASPVEADEHEARLSAASATSTVDRLATVWTLAGLGWDAAEWD
jgi:hypothetical protein